MQTTFSLTQLADPQVYSAEKILRACVHCGFCNATCPTYVLLGDELDGPRGRIYLIKDMLEHERPATREVVKHIDRCLSCLSCMTTCPSGVHYMHLVDHAREHIEKTYKRPLFDRAIRALLARVLTDPALFRLAAVAGWIAKPLAPLLRALRFDTRLAGAGAQLFWEAALCLPIRRAGWRLVYDPAIAVEHHVEPRSDGDQLHRGVFASAALADATHNETLVLLENRGRGARAAFLAWALLVGTHHEPGLAQLPRLVLRGDRHAVARWRAALEGRLRGWRRWRTELSRPAAAQLPPPPAR